MVLPTAGWSSAADEGVQLSARTFMVAPGVATPSLDELKAGGGVARLTAAMETAARTTPMEVVGPAATYGVRSTVPATVASDEPTEAGAAAAPPKVVYPEPARTMTLKECKQKMAGTARVYVKSRMAVCTGLKVTTTWARGSGQVGMSSYVVYVRGVVPKDNDRTVYFTYDVTDFTIVGTTGASGLKIGLKGTIPQDWPARATPVLGKALPVTKTWLQMQSKPSYIHTVRYAPGQGTGAGAADLIAAVYQPEVISTLPAGWVGESPQTGRLFMFAPRWDAAPYLRNSTGGSIPANRGGAVFSMIGTLQYRTKAGAPEQAVARHIKQAFTNPRATKPLNALKNVPGDNVNEPLNRLFLDERRHERNHTLAVQECKRSWGARYTDGGKQCDEFPFASTYQGAALAESDPHAEKKNFSVLPVPGTQNRDAGILLRGFYNSNRIIDGVEDGFIVKID
ncbi:NucA/NucB deoxyribonuclease domain-containing protein [Streptomyces sp. NPDC002073]